MCIDEAKRKRLTRKAHGKSWAIRREQYYGFTKYDKNLCNYICQHVSKGTKLLEVAVGSGYPNADFLQKAGYVVYGIDIAPELIDKCQKLNPYINCKVGDAEELEYSDDYFDATYCFHSTWYFPNLNKAVDEMLRVTRPGGIVLFDIQNLANEMIAKEHRQRLLERTGVRRVIKFARDIGAVILRRSVFNWHFLFHFVIHETPTYPESIYQHLKGIAKFQVMVRKEDESIETRSELGSFEDFGRLIFVIEK